MKAPSRLQLEPNTTLFPVPVVLISCGVGDNANLLTLNRIASCNAEPPMISISVRPGRASHQLIEKHDEFVVNIPSPELELVTDFVGSTTSRKINKWRETGLTPVPAVEVRAPLVAECPVNIECRVQQKIKLPSHTLFLAEVVALHAEKYILNARQEVDIELVLGLHYRSGQVRERPVEAFRPQELLAKVRAWRNGH